MLGLLYPLGLRGAVSRSFYEHGTVEERKERMGTLWIAMAVSAGVMALALDRLGPWLAGTILPEVPFHPYLRLAVWTAFLGVLGLAPLALLQAQERQRRVRGGDGRFGALDDGSDCMAGGSGSRRRGLPAGSPDRRRSWRRYPISGSRLARSDRCFEPRVLVAALGYSLPLVPHTLAGWALEMSDRAILTRLLPLHDVGVYSLGYQLGAVLGLLTTAFNAAWVPLLFGTLKAEGEAAHARLARLATYYAMVLCFIGLGWSLLVEYAIVLFAGPEFRGAHRITPWVVGGYVFAGLYLIPTNLLFWRQQTRVFPLVTLAAGAVNVGLNLWLVPQYGTIAAAWSTLAAYASLLLLTWRSAERVHPFPYEYRRVGLIAGHRPGSLPRRPIPSIPQPGLRGNGTRTSLARLPVGPRRGRGLSTALSWPF